MSGAAKRFVRRRLLRPPADLAQKRGWKRTYWLLNQAAKYTLSPQARARAEARALEEFLLYGPIGREAYEAWERYDKARRKYEKMLDLIDVRYGY